MADGDVGHRIKTSNLFIDIPDDKWPIVYSSQYGTSSWLGKLVGFDSEKGEKIHKFLKDDKLLRDDTTIEPLEASENDLLVVHSVEYLRSLKDALKIAKIVEFALGVLPNFFNILQPFRFQTGGTILAGEIALKRGWSINLGGGFHHCSGNEGGRYCPYADITLLIKFMREKHPEIVHVMIIDLGAHQGTGYQRDIVDSKDTQTYVLDMYNPDTYPKDGYAKTAINRKEELKSYMEDAEYLELVQTHVEGALKELTLKESPPDVVVYNAGTDVLDGDPLGKLAVTRKGVIERDFIVFKAVRDQKIPIIMLTSGGYERSNARIIADSILNLHKEGKLTVNKQSPSTHIQQPRQQPL